MPLPKNTSWEFKELFFGGKVVFLCELYNFKEESFFFNSAPIRRYYNSKKAPYEDGHEWVVQIVIIWTLLEDAGKMIEN